MKLSFAALVFLLATVAGSFRSPARRVKTRHNEGYLTSAAKPANLIRGNIGKTYQQQHTPTPKPKILTGKSSNAKSNENGRQNMVQPTRSPKTNPPIGKSGNAKSGTDGQTKQQLLKQKDAIQYTTTPKSNPSTRKSNNAKSGKMLQQRMTSTLKPPKARMLRDSPFDKDGKTQDQQDATENTPNPTLNPGNAGKSGNSKSGKDGQIKQQQNPVTNYTLTSTFKPPTAEKLGNLSNVKDGQSHQNESHQTSTVKPLTEEFSNSSSGKIRETHQQQNNFSSRTDFYHNYVYRPPQQISYGSAILPVYQGHPPIYVYEYRDSGSRFGNLLTGLALYNLGRNSQLHHYNSDKQYSSTSGEICKLGISKRTGEYEETRIDCNLMSSFIWEGTTSAARNEQHVVKNTTEVTVTRAVNGTGNSTMTMTSNTVEDALKVKGSSIAVTPGMTCYMIRTLGAITVMRKPVDCGLLQEYARSSLFRNNAQCLSPFMWTAFNFLIIFIARKYCEQFML